MAPSGGRELAQRERYRTRLSWKLAGEGAVRRWICWRRVRVLVVSLLLCLECDRSSRIRSRASSAQNPVPVCDRERRPSTMASSSIAVRRSIFAHRKHLKATKTHTHKHILTGVCRLRTRRLSREIERERETVSSVCGRGRAERSARLVLGQSRKDSLLAAHWLWPATDSLLLLGNAIRSGLLRALSVL